MVRNSLFGTCTYFALERPGRRIVLQENTYGYWMNQMLNLEGILFDGKKGNGYNTTLAVDPITSRGAASQNKQKRRAKIRKILNERTNRVNLQTIS